MEHPTRARRALTTVLAVFLAVESVSAVAAAAVTTSTAVHHIPPEPPAGRVLAVEAAAVEPVEITRAATAPAFAPRVLEPAESPAAAAPAVPDGVADKPAKAGKTDRATKADQTARSQKGERSGKRTKSAPRPSPAKPAARSYSGTNHVWIPSLGISRSVRWFPCERSRPPDNFMYRWGCSGSNNVYVMGHAYSVMKPLHDAYVRGRLRIGMKAYYADGAGKVRTYSVKWWRVTRPTTSASWAWAAQSVPSMTLQTCVGKDGQYRLMVRLTIVRG